MLSVHCSHGVAADHQMYSMLISKAGKAKDVDSALGLHQQMLDSHLPPTQVGRHAALFVCWHGFSCCCMGSMPPLVAAPTSAYSHCLVPGSSLQSSRVAQAATRLQAGLSFELPAVTVSAVCHGHA